MNGIIKSRKQRVKKNIKRCCETNKIINGKEVLIAREEIVKEWLTKQGYMITRLCQLNLMAIAISHMLGVL